MAGIILFLQSHEDLKTGMIDSRRNWFMYGVLASLYPIYHPSILTVLSGIAIAIVARRQLRRHFGDGDIEIFNWLTVGLIVISPVKVVLLYMFVAVFYAVVRLGSRYIDPDRKKIPFVPCIFAAFIASVIF